MLNLIAGILASYCYEVVSVITGTYRRAILEGNVECQGQLYVSLLLARSALVCQTSAPGMSCIEAAKF